MENPNLMRIFNKQNLLNQRFMLALWAVVAVVGSVSRYFSGYNNYKIFKGVFLHYYQQLPLYGEIYSTEYYDSNHYGPLFAFLIAPFAMMPDWLGLLSWMVLSVWLLYYAIRLLPIEPKWQSMIMLMSINELFTAVSYQQYNIAVAALMILVFVCIERKREGWAVLLILIGAFTKIYGILGLAFFFFVKRKWRFVWLFALWAVVLFALPMIFTSPQYVISQYAEWITKLGGKNAENMFSELQNISILGVIRKISGNPNYSDLPIMGGGVVLFLMSYLRIVQYKNLGFRLMMLASILLFIPLFSSGSENCTYIIAILGVGIWLAATPVKRNALTWTLVGLVLFASFAGNLLPRNLYMDYFLKYALKAVPFALVWLRVCYEMLFCDFTITKQDEKTDINRIASL